MEAAATLEPAAEQLLRAQISDALRVQSARPYAASPQAAALAFETIVSELCTAAVAEGPTPPAEPTLAPATAAAHTAPATSGGQTE